MMENLSLYATAVLFTIHLVSLIVAAPVPTTNGPWVNPCGGESVSGLSLNHPTSSSPSITEELLSLQRISRAAMNQTDSLILSINQGISADVQKYLDTHPPLDGFPATGVSFTPGIQIDDMVKIEIQRLSKIGVFLEAARLDTNAYSDRIRTLEQKNAEMLCKLHTMLPGRGVVEDVSRDIMPTKYRHWIDTTKIDGRNYIIMRDVKKIIVAIKESFEAYKIEHNL